MLDIEYLIRGIRVLKVKGNRATVGPSRTHSTPSVECPNRKPGPWLRPRKNAHGDFSA